MPDLSFPWYDCPHCRFRHPFKVPQERGCPNAKLVNKPVNIPLPVNSKPGTNRTDYMRDYMRKRRVKGSDS